MIEPKDVQVFTDQLAYMRQAETKGDFLEAAMYARGALKCALAMAMTLAEDARSFTSQAIDELKKGKQ